MLEYNDYELLYLISEGEEIALDILMEKYTLLIKKRISTFKIQKRCYDDFFQEGLYSLTKAIESYDQNYCKTFTLYFDLILQRRFMNLLKRDYNYFYEVSLVEDASLIKGYVLKESPELYEADEKRDKLHSDFDRNIYDLLKRGFKPSEVATKLNLTRKKVYNTIEKIKKITL